MMKILLGNKGDVEVLLAFKGQEGLEKHNELYTYLKKKEIFKGDLCEIYSLISPNENVIFLGLGDREKLKLQSLRKAFYKVGKELMRLKVESAKVSIPKFENLCYKNTCMAIAEGLLQSEYSFDKYLSEKKNKHAVKEFYLDVLEDKKERAQEAIDEIYNVIDGIFLTRDLVNEPAIVLTPKELAKRAKEELEPLGVEVEVLGKEKIEGLGMKAFLAVSKGSANEPQFIIMKWNGDKNSSKKVALVGKGITYDSGGYSIKTHEGMATMFNDMAGAASVIGTMKAIAKSKIEKNVVALVAACENLISGEAYKPGDIISSMAGKTIEVVSTDAEGRLTLADALWYAATEEKADKIVDVATLTGACVVALGNVNIGAITNSDDLMKEIKEASELAGEPVWQLPSNEEYKEQIIGTFADLKNSGGRGAGTITAGLFLGEFVNNTPWVHLDIAGKAYSTNENGYLPKGATGIPVKTLYNFVKNA